MPIQGIYTVKSNQNIARDVFSMRLMGPTGAFTAPGQFVNLHIDGFFLRRPFSVCRWDSAGFEIIYKLVGTGTANLALYGPGSQIDLLAGLGNGFNVEAARGRQTLLVGGGVGTPPLYALAAALKTIGVTPTVALGFASAQDVFYLEEFVKLGCKTYLTTEDGSAGTEGFITGPIASLDYDYYFACGPEAMLKAVWALGEEKGAQGQLSFEERMGCGFGTCMGCSRKTKTGYKRVCADGPVFSSGEVVFE